MRKFILLLLSVLCISAGANAQNISDGYYRVTNAVTDRYIHVLDNKGSLNLQASTADMGAIMLKKGIDRAVSDPASVLYVEAHGSQYDIRAQNTGINSMIGVYVNIMKSPSVPNAYWAYGKKGSVILYLWDVEANKDIDDSYLDTKGANRDWYIKPIDNSTDNYFGVQPTHQANGKYYASFYAAFPFSLESSGMKAYYISKVDEAQGVAVYKEITGTIPALTPVIIECSSADPSGNKLNIGGSGAAVTGNLGKGVLFDLHKYHHDNFVSYDKSSMRTIGLASDGSLAMTSADYKDVPKNTFYIQVSASCPAALKLVHESQYKEGPVEATSITLNHSSLALNVGASASLTANVAPDNTTDKTVTWKSSNPAVASVDANGTVKALSAGDATITASCGKVSASCSVSVSNIEATSITLSETNVTLTIGNWTQISATVAPDNATDKTVTWTSSDPSVATVDRWGTIRAFAAGKTTITASCGKVSASCSVTVTNVEATSVTLSSVLLNLTPGATATLHAEIYPSNTTDKTLIWSSSDSSVATVDANGTVTAVAVGSAIITAACGEASGACSVTVSPVDAASIELSSTSIQINIGQQTRIGATVLPEDATDKTITWDSSNPEIVSVDADGMITGVAEGTAVVSATCGSAMAFCTVTVTPIKAESISLDRSELTLNAGDTETLVATILPVEVADKNVIWTSSDASVAEVSLAGVVTAIAPGTAVITAEVDGIVAECTVTVLAVEAEGITLSDTAIEITVPDTYQLTATVIPDNTTDKTLSWTSSNPSVATVDAEGLVKAIHEGNVIITVTCGSAKAECAVKVNPFDSIYDIISDGEAFDVYTLQGIKVRSQVTSLDGLAHGFYIVNGHTIRH